MKRLIRNRIDKHFNHIYCLNTDMLEDALPMLSFDVWLAYQKINISNDNANQILDSYVKYLNSYFLYLDHEFFKHFSSLTLLHYKLLSANYYYEQFLKLHSKYIIQVDYTKEALIYTATHKINAVANPYTQEVH